MNECIALVFVHRRAMISILDSNFIKYAPINPNEAIFGRTFEFDHLLSQNEALFQKLQYVRLYVHTYIYSFSYGNETNDKQEGVSTE